MQEFHRDTLESKFIKKLLKSTPLPIYPSVSRGDYVILNHKYYYNGNIIKSTASNNLYQNFTIVEDIDKKSTYTQYISKYSYYDTETHEQFGKYLDYYKSTTGIDLKPFYNCFSDRYNDRFQYHVEHKLEELEEDHIITEDDYNSEEPAIIKYSFCGKGAFDSILEVKVNSVEYDDAGSFEQLSNERYYYDIARHELYIMNNNASVLVENNEVVTVSYKATIKKYVYDQNSNLKNSIKVMMIPIKFDKIYTVAIDSGSEVVIRPFLYTYGRLLDNLNVKINNFTCAYSYNELVNHTPDKDIKLENGKLEQDSKPCVLQRTYFNRPFLFNVSLSDDSLSTSDKDRLKDNERYLYLFIQIQKLNDSSIVVLEGNHLADNNTNIINFEKRVYSENQTTLLKNLVERNKDGYFDFMNSNINNSYNQYRDDAFVKALSIIDKDKSTSFMLTDASLLRLNTKKSYAFSDRIIEYLLHNTITNQEELSGNIITVNSRLGLVNERAQPIPEWLDKTQYRVFLDMRDKGIDDINGYVDKDTEEIMGW